MKSYTTPDLFTPIVSDCAPPSFAEADPQLGRVTRTEAAILREATGILERRVRAAGDVLGSPAILWSYLTVLLGALAREVFVVVYLDSQNGLIAADQAFQGTVNQTAVYPREIARRALELNAAACILAHCHPSGVPDPSSADRHLTRCLQTALATFDIQVLDHVIIAGTKTYSFAEHGQI